MPSANDLHGTANNSKTILFTMEESQAMTFYKMCFYNVMLPTAVSQILGCHQKNILLHLSRLYRLDVHGMNQE